MKLLDGLLTKEGRAMSKAERLIKKCHRTAREALRDVDLDDPLSLGTWVLRDEREKSGVAPEKMKELRQRTDALVKHLRETKDVWKNKRREGSIYWATTARYLLTVGDLEKGEKAINVSLGLNPENASAWYWRGIIHMKKGNPGEAAKSFDMAIARGGGKEAWSGKGDALAKMGKIEDAIKAYEKVLELDPTSIEHYDRILMLKPDDVDTWERKGMALNSMGDAEGAIASWKECIKLDKKHAGCWRHLADLYREMGEYEKAHSVLQDALQSVPENPSLWEAKGDLEYEMALYEDAVESYRNAIKHGGDEGTLGEKLADSLYALDRFEEALAEYEKALALRGGKNAEDEISLLLKKKDVLLELKRYDEAKDVCEKILEKDPDNFEALAAMGAIYHKQKQYEKAVEYYDRALKHRPDDMDVLLAKKKALRHLGRFEEMVETCKKILSHNPHDKKTWVDMGDGLMALQRPVEAGDAYKKALSVDREYLPALIGLKKSAKETENHSLVVEIGDRILQQRPDDVETLSDQAEALEKMGNLAGALKCYERIIAIKDTSSARKRKGFIHLKLREAKEALEEFEKSAHHEEGKKDPEVWKGMGMALSRMGNYAEAISAFENSVEMAPENDAETWFEKGLAHEALRQYEEALESYRKAISIDPNLYHAYERMGAILLEMGRGEEALGILDKATHLRPEEPIGWVLKGRALDFLGKVEDALYAYQKAIENGLRDPATLREILSFCMRNEYWENAEEIATEILRHNPKDTDALVERARARYNAGKKKEAISDYMVVSRKTLGEKTSDFSLQFEFLDILQKEGLYREIIQVCDDILSVDPENDRALMKKADALEKTGRLKEALDVYNLLAGRNKKDHELWNKIGRLYEMLGEDENALTAYKKALDLNPKNPEYILDMATALAYMGRYREAAEHLERCLKLSPENPEVWNLYGLSLFNIGEMEKALEALEKAARLAPDNPEVWYNRGVVLAATKSWERALTSFENAIRTGYEEKEIHLAMARCLAALGRREEALEKYSEYLSILQSEKEGEEGKKETNKTEMAEVESEIAALLAEMGRHSEALEHIERAIERDRHNPLLWVKKAGILEKLGKKDETITALENAIGMGLSDVSVFLNLGRLLHETGRYEEAIRIYERALALDPSSKAAEQGKKMAEEALEKKKIEDYARRVLEREHAMGRPLTKEEIFKLCGVPYAYLAPVMRLLNTPERVVLSSLTPGEREWYEKASLEVIRNCVLQDRDRIAARGLSLSDIVVRLGYDIETAKKVLEYIRRVDELDIRNVEPDPDLEALAKDVLYDPALNREDIADVMNRYGIGIWRAKQLLALLNQLSGETLEIPSYRGSFATPSATSSATVSRPSTAMSPQTQARTKPSPPATRPAGVSATPPSTGMPSRLTPPPGGKEGAPAPRAPRVKTAAHRDRKCSVHGNIAVAYHDCGAALCKQCLFLSTCPSCGQPLSQDSLEYIAKKDEKTGGGEDKKEGDGGITQKQQRHAAGEKKHIRRQPPAKKDVKKDTGKKDDELRL